MFNLPSYMESYTNEEHEEAWGTEDLDDDYIEYNKEFENE